MHHLSSDQRHTRCLHCNNKALLSMKGYEAAGLVKCGHCGFVFSKFIPTIEELIAHYETYPRHDTISPITLQRYDELAEDLKDYATNKHWIDIGCGNGHLLTQVRKKGWIPFGTEFTDTAVSICRSKGINIHQGPLNPADYAPESFDVITFIEVLEHINNPQEEIENFRSLMRKGGALYITTPNFNSISRKMLKSGWNIIEYPEHLCYYTPETLHQLLSQHGFKKIKLTSTGITPSRLLRTTSNFATKSKGQEYDPGVSDEQLRNITETNPIGILIKKTLNSLLSFTGTGDTLKALYTKY